MLELLIPAARRHRMKTILLVLFCLLGLMACTGSNSEDAASLTPTADDNRLATVIAQNNLTRLSEPTTEATELVTLGEALFNDPLLSGPKNISCSSCHNVAMGSGDNLPLSIGTGASGLGLNRFQINGESRMTPRNSPPLFNLGRTEQLNSFFDGRVRLANGVVTSPVTEINGNNPTRRDIASAFRNSVDAQALFPILNAVEMLGNGNDLSAHTSEVDTWDSLINDRVLKEARYITLFASAYPQLTPAELNVGHIGRAIGAFIKIKFKSNNTPFDRYIEGDLRALSDAQKRGMIVFYNRGQCMRCHSGSNLTDNNFHSVGAPQIGPTPFVDDLGRQAFTNNNNDRYKFKTPSLRNVALTAPYMHNGAFASLEDVVGHYNNVTQSLNNYRLPASHQSQYQTLLVIDTNTTRNQTRISQIDIGAIRNGLNLSAQERSDLVDFLRNGLRDPGF